MRRPWRRLLAGALLTVGLAPVGYPATDCPGSGFGGTGNSAPGEDGTGFGGTGAQPCAGSTPLGVVGVITGFGSIFVGGQEIHYPPDAAIQTPAGTRTPSALRLGQTVVVRARSDGSRVDADRIAIAPVLVGPVQAASANTLLALGQPVHITARTRLAGFGKPGIAPGDRVAVYGLRTADGSVIATRVARRRPADWVYLEGPPHRAADGSVSILGQRLRLPTNASDMPAGPVQALTGTLAGDGAIDVRTLALAPAARLINTLPDGGRLIIEGYVHSQTGTDLRLGSIGISTHADALRIGPPPAVGDYARVTVVNRAGAFGLTMLEGQPASAWPGLDSAGHLELPPDLVRDRLDLPTPGLLLEPPLPPPLSPLFPGGPGSGLYPALPSGPYDLSWPDYRR